MRIAVSAQAILGRARPACRGGRTHGDFHFYLDKALDNGLKKEEVIEVITHLASYCGWPNAMSAIMVAKELFSKRGTSS